MAAAAAKGCWYRGLCWSCSFVRRFELAFVPKPLPRDPLRALRKVPGEATEQENEVLPSLNGGKGGKAAHPFRTGKAEAPVVWWGEPRP